MTARTEGDVRRTRRSREEWAGLVAEQDALGMSAPAFAAARGLSVSTLRWWRWKLGQGASTVGVDVMGAGRLVEVRLAASGAPGWEAEEESEEDSVYLSLPGGVELELPETPSPRWLAALCLALQAKRHRNQPGRPA